jgi:hypothetical protein
VAHDLLLMGDLLLLVEDARLDLASLTLTPLKVVTCRIRAFLQCDPILCSPLVINGACAFGSGTLRHAHMQCALLMT